MKNLAVACCGTCRQSRLEKGAFACLFLNMAPVTFTHVCYAFEALSGSRLLPPRTYTPAFHHAEEQGGFPSCSASTTATNSGKPEKPDFWDESNPLDFGLDPLELEFLL